jgi:hypothetical protein
MRVLDAERGRRYESRMVDALSRVLREGDRQLASTRSP